MGILCFLLFFIYIHKNSLFTTNIDHILINFVTKLGINIDKCFIMEYIDNKYNIKGRGEVIIMGTNEIVTEKSSLDEEAVCGYYYLSREVCKNIIITAGLSGVHSAQAVKEIRSKIYRKKEMVGEIMSILKNINEDVISYYAGELAESLVYAAESGKGMEIAIGYPKILVISVN